MKKQETTVRNIAKFDLKELSLVITLLNMRKQAAQEYIDTQDAVKQQEAKNKIVGLTDSIKKTLDL